MKKIHIKIMGLTRPLLLLVFLFLVHYSIACHPALIPYPESYCSKPGSFLLTPASVIIIDKKIAANESDFFIDLIAKVYGIKLSVSAADSKENCIYLTEDLQQAAEGYKMEVNNKNVLISGRGAGIFYGLQTLFQCIEKNEKNELLIQCCSVTDKPRFTWRGMHLDVSRHFFPKEFIKTYIDYLAMYKMNTFHWHLVDDQGWRIEIKKYPALTNKGAYRNGTLTGHAGLSNKYDTIRYGGYYTQEEIREIVAYATKRHVTVVPEIEMPGHSLAALSAYPQYACTRGPFEAARTWGVFEDVYCPKEETYSFLKDILTEVMELFPGKYIHIGGDECPKTRWEKCEECQVLMKKKGLKNEMELQSYFISRIDSFVTSKGRSIIGWDEILEGGLAPNAAVMSWRGTEGGKKAARMHHYVVMTPGSHCYFDHYQANPLTEPLAIGGYTPVRKVFRYKPVPKKLKSDEKNFIMGAQGNVWTEYLDKPSKVEYMIFPRICALSEVVWKEGKRKTYRNFRKRQIQNFKILDKLNVSYSKAIF